MKMMSYWIVSLKMSYSTCLMRMKNLNWIAMMSYYYYLIMKTMNWNYYWTNWMSYYYWTDYWMKMNSTNCLSSMMMN